MYMLLLYIIHKLIKDIINILTMKTLENVIIIYNIIWFNKMSGKINKYL